MKKFVFCLMAIGLSLTFMPLQLNAATIDKPSSLVAPKPTEPAESAEAKALVLRLNEISAMDMSKLKSAEKKTLRKEVRSIKHELRDISGGVYISAGLLILILILLVVLL
jgi:hypothetical protein